MIKFIRKFWRSKPVGVHEPEDDKPMDYYKRGPGHLPEANQAHSVKGTLTVDEEGNVIESVIEDKE
jgi:hypothetical protein